MMRPHGRSGSRPSVPQGLRLRPRDRRLQRHDRSEPPGPEIRKGCPARRPTRRGRSSGRSLEFAGSRSKSGGSRSRSSRVALPTAPKITAGPFRCEHPRPDAARAIVALESAVILFEAGRIAHRGASSGKRLCGAPGPRRPVRSARTRGAQRAGPGDLESDRTGVSTGPNGAAVGARPQRGRAASRAPSGSRS